MKSRLNELLNTLEEVTNFTHIRVSKEWIKAAKSELQQLRDKRDELQSKVNELSRGNE